MPNIQLEDLITTATKAGKETLDFYKEKISVETKDDDSPLTKADLASEKILLDELGRFDIPILSEESEDDKARLSSDRVIIIDPLDGTSDFIQKTDDYSIMIGVVEKGSPVMGVVYHPVSETVYFASEGDGAYKRQAQKDTPLSVSSIDSLQEMTILLSRNHLLDAEQQFMKESHVDKQKKMGSAGLKMSTIAEGKAEIYINSSDRTCEWDTCAGNIIVTEAGGMVTDLKNELIEFNKKDPRHLDGFLVTNNTKHMEILEEVQKYL